MTKMKIELGQKARHKDLYEGKETFEIIGIKRGEVLLEGDFSGGTHNLKQEGWMPIKGLILQNVWGRWVDKESDVDFTKNAGRRE
jgi:hypothetical protein